MSSPHDSFLKLADADPGLRRWEQVAQALREDLSAGRFAPGAKLPNESQLAGRFGVNRHTLRQAVQALAREGYVQVVHGSGTYARRLVVDYALQLRTRLSENLAQAGERAQRELLRQSVERGGEWAAALRLGGRAEVELLRTRALVRGRPVALTRAAFVRPRLAGIGEVLARCGSVTEALRELGVADYTRARSTIAARLPEGDEADLLARPPRQPVLVVHYLNVDRDGVPLEAGCTLFAADAVQLTVDPEGWSGEP